jgi:hypothetical protein
MLYHKTPFSDILQSVEKTGILPIIIVQIGKVGSKTIFNTLGQLNLGHPIWHVHSIRNYFYSWQEEHSSNKESFADVLKSKVNPSKKNEKLKVISLVRDPIARKISSFFQSYKSPKNSRLISDPVNIERLIQEFLDRFKPKCPYDWFDQEIKPIFNIDVFKEKFDKGIGYKIYENDQIDLLVIKLEKLNSCYQQAFYQFMGIKNLHLISGNVGKNRYYADIYSEIIKNIIISESYIEIIYESNRFKHFYSQEEISALRDKWINSSVLTLAQNRR